VQKVEYTSEKVMVTAWDTANNSIPREFTGDFVISAASLGVLKSNSIQFQPPLPSWKQQAID